MERGGGNACQAEKTLLPGGVGRARWTTLIIDKAREKKGTTFNIREGKGLYEVGFLDIKDKTRHSIDEARRVIKTSEDTDSGEGNHFLHEKERRGWSHQIAGGTHSSPASEERFSLAP